MSSPKKLTGIQAPLDISDELAKIIGTAKGEQLSRPQVIKKLWAYLKEKNLQDPEMKQWFTPDKTMQPIFGKEKIKCFSMSKYLKEHLTQRKTEMEKKEEKPAAGKTSEASDDNTPEMKETSDGKTPEMQKKSTDDLQICPHLPSPKGKDLAMALKHLPRSGWLEQAPQGMVYVDLDDNWILAVRELLNEYGYDVSPLFFPTQRGDPSGAHIVLVSSQEAKQHGLLGGDVEAGKKVNFSVRRCGLSKPRRWNSGTQAMIKVWVKGKELETIRKRLVGKKAKGGFYIVVGVRSIRTARMMKRAMK